MNIDAEHIERQRVFSEKTFGPGPRTQGVLDHIRKELVEIEQDPFDLGEWVDVIILAIDGAWRAGHEPQQIIDKIKAKQAKNEARTWPDWRTAPEGKAIEHDRTGESVTAPIPDLPVSIQRDVTHVAVDQEAAEKLRGVVPMREAVVTLEELGFESMEEFLEHQEKMRPYLDRMLVLGHEALNKSLEVDQ